MNKGAEEERKGVREEERQEFVTQAPGRAMTTDKN